MDGGVGLIPKNPRKTYILNRLGPHLVGGPNGYFHEFIELGPETADDSWQASQAKVMRALH